MATEHNLLKDVQDELDWDMSIDNRGIVVSVSDDGIVTLAGQVSSFAEKVAAENAAKCVAGVWALANEIEVRPCSKGQRPDKEIAEAAITALRSNTSVPARHVKVLVNDGWLTLEGEVGVRHQQKAAEDAVRHLWGVRGITNRITLRPEVGTPADIKNKIQQAFQRHASLDANRLQVEVSDGTVTLTGQVDSWHEREAAEKAAWAAPGVIRVDNRLTIRI